MYDEQEKAPVRTDMDPPSAEAGDPTASAYDFGATVLEALENAPGRCAYRFNGTTLTRHQLREEALALAARLKDAGLRPGAPVAIEIEHSLELAVAMCGVQAAGACAVPIDPAVGAERREAILADIRPAFALTRPVSHDSERRIEIERGAAPEEAHDEYDPGLAFIVYTSGTSGGPKGVMITAESYVRRMRHIVPAIVTQDDDTDLAWTPSSFITMVDELFLPLLCGVPTIIAEPAIRTDPRAFLALVQQEGVTTFRITPSLLNVVLRSRGAAAALSGVRTLICSGEAVPAELQRMVHRQLSARLLGFYGATEAPAAAKTDFDPDAPPIDTTICTPQPFVGLRVMREDGTDAAAGETGEIWVGGCALARGYYRRPELTAAKFLEQDGERWYRTGDRARQLDDGRVELIGRIDLSEVNLHGVRVSLTEIRDALRRLDSVEDAWISVIEQEAGRDPVLVGHCIPARGTAFDAARTRTEITAHLPILAVPRHLLAHDRFPLTANGKLDVQELAQAADTAMTASLAAASTRKDRTGATPAEIAVLNCFEQALGKRHFSLDDNFFAVGGTSLEAVTLACYISEQFETEIGFEEIWLHPSPREMSAYIAAHGGQSAARTFFHVEGVSGPNLVAIGFGVRHLAGLWPDRRLLVSPGIAGDPRITLHKRLDDYVSEYIAGLRRIQPKGPYQLIGFSFHGLLAYEIARRLHAEGEEISGIALLEPVTPLARTTSPSYDRTAHREILGALVTGRLGRARSLQRLTANSRAGSRARSRGGMQTAYGYVVVAAERLEPLPVPIDLIYCQSYAGRALARWKAVAGSNLRLCQVTSENHQSLIRPDCVKQWKDVVGRWTG